MDDLYISLVSQTSVALHLVLLLLLDTLLVYPSILSSHDDDDDDDGDGSEYEERENGNSDDDYDPFLYPNQNWEEKKNRVYSSYKKTREKGQGSEADMASLKRVKKESVRDFGILLILYCINLISIWSFFQMELRVFLRARQVYLYRGRRILVFLKD